MNTLKNLGLAMVCFFLFSCTQKKSDNNINHHPITAILWQQHASEYQALVYQGFNIAKAQLEIHLANSIKSNKPLAIITDIDETVLDNTPYNAKMALLGKDFNKQSWLDWGLQKSAKPLPGALSFFTYVAEKGVEVFYISNRYVEQKQETLENLKALGFPFADTTHLLLKDGISGKETRRNSVESTHEILLLLGDNLSDFSEVFDDRTKGKAHENVVKYHTAFGKKFIVFPNPIYGHWETKEIYNSKYDWTPAQKDSIRLSKLISY